MAVHYRVSGFILKKKDIREADRVFTIYTKDLGKLEFLAKGERKIKSKLRRGLELFYLSEIEFIQGRTYKTITDVLLVKGFKRCWEDLRTLSVAYKISETLDCLIKGEEPDKEIWDLVADVFEKLDNWKISFHQLLEIGSSEKANHHLSIIVKRPEFIYYYFFWNFVSCLGYKPQLYKCVLCQRQLKEDVPLFFSPKEGGVICQSCARRIGALD